MILPGQQNVCVLNIWGQRPREVHAAPIFRCVSRVLTMSLYLMFVAEAADYSFPTQFLMVTLRNHLSYLSVKMSQEYLVRCYQRIFFFFLLKSLYRECTANSRPAWLNAMLYLVERPLQGHQNSTQIRKRKMLHHHVLFSIFF